VAKSGLNRWQFTDSERCIPGSVRPFLLVGLFFGIFDLCCVNVSMESKAMYRGMMIVVGMLVALLAMALESPAQTHDGYIYGKVYTDRTTYVGVIRWGGEEVFWTDLFNAAKRDNDYAKLVPQTKEDKDWWSNYDWNFSSIWEDKGTVHQFVCQFGNIKEVIPTNRGNVILKLKNGGELEVDGEGYNDVGGKVQIIDEELGTVSISWDRVQRVEFLPTPTKLELVFGQPLYGTVEGVRKEKFTGFIIWDNDERVSSDKLDGDNEDGDVSIKFSEIEMIERSGNGSEVKLKSGRSMFLDNSNDVNNGNRGVWVVHPDYGVINFSWKAFKRVTFAPHPNTGQSFNQFPSPQPMQATISLLDDDDISGRIIYDIDEALDFELVEGKENDIEYQIPLRNIKRITPKNFDYSLIELKSGQTLLLGGARDVSDDNSGLLVFVKGKKEPVHIAWKKINAINFN
jgi:hypothetical protein